RELNNRARLGLNWSSLGDLNARVLEISAMRLCPIIDRVSDLSVIGFEEGKHYLGFDNLDEAVLRVQWALNSPHEAEEIALAAYNKVNMEDFTYDALVSKVLKEFRLDE
ncbi:glycosyltransferase family 1 protein, partial [Candidatus Peregrinibacteria bacterium]|nr:glycosyltransferase family 1 protein [Candidatus Peregrinibacteria bacterium]